MQTYVLKRFGEMIITLLLMSIVIFSLSRLTGDPVALLLSDYATDEDRQRIILQLGLDKPVWQQYFQFLWNALRGDLGVSIMGNEEPTINLILERLPASFQLAGIALLFSLLIGIPLGVYSAVYYGSMLDKTARVVALLGQSVPAFWLGLVLMYFFGVRLGWLPTSGYGEVKHLIMPAFTMGVFTVAAVTRLVRISMLETLDAEYVKFARIKGVSEFKVVWRHALRNSLIPVVTFMGTFFATMITGAVVIETVFSWPGVGRLAFEAILNRDFPLIQAVVLFMASAFILVNLLVDLLYAYLDPRIRYSTIAK
ncbi:MAG: ABC transporter permease [Cellvibrionaceae bacterium]